MLAKKNRLRKKKEFNFIYKKGEVYYSKFLALYVSKTKLPDKKVGFSVSNKVGNSVIRSRVKRIISEACRLNIDKFAVKNYVITARESIVNKKSTEIEEQLLQLLKKNNLMR